ncbi:ERO1-like protein alpha isoform X2 [Pomacea canaliculata]|uniref:ERO1-like protein alpha isoform X2 n=1 Tax=Pomacea canaliculata TaxID=400727 RepID=UPI000D735051|nr:ERO1-like protein alpha isoform X2 [Pomacea canaliculata]
MWLSQWLFAIFISLHHVTSAQWSDNVADRCFCKLQGEVDDCSCKVESLDSLNNNKIYPRLQSLLSKNYFRYFKVNLQKPCPFWSDDSQCALKDCHVDVCTQDELPDDVKETKHERENKYSKSAQIEHTCEEERELSALDTTLSDESKQAFANWKDYDDSLDMFCEVDDEDSAQMQHVDLLLNPERYTGYKGASPHRIWRSVYEENCFKPSETWTYGQEKESLSSMCLEKRAFYRMVSGLHTSINIHLSDRYLLRSDDAFGSQKWGPNVQEFRSRFDPETTDGQGPQRLKNLYFTYLVELRALAKAAPYLLKERFYTGDGQADKEMRDAVQNLLQIIQDFPDHFDESKLFQGNSMESKKLKMEFRDHFRNISRIMDCVGCDKCRLWGKLQVLGMGTALKILFSGNAMGPDSTVNANFKADFQLTRTEIVALFNAFGRLSSSIRALENFRSLMR